VTPAVASPGPANPASPGLAAHVWSCAHCGLPVPGRRVREQAAADIDFCCEGCRAVHAIITGCSLERYYAIKKDSASFAPAAPAAPGGARYGYLDDPAVREKYACGPAGRSMDFFIEGVHCVACLWLLERLGTLVSGVQSARMDLGTRILRVTLGENGSFAAAAEGVDRLGYKPHPVFEDRQTASLQNREDRKDLLRIGVAAFCTMNIMILFVSIYGGADGGTERAFLWLSGLLYLPVAVFCAWPFYRSAWSSSRARQLHIDLPVASAMIIGSTASYVKLFMGGDDVYFDSIASFIFLLISVRFMVRTVHRKAASRGGIGEFLIPASALVEDPAGGQARAVTADRITAGDMVRVPHGETIPVDGEVVGGSGFADLHMLSGESEPVPVSDGSAVHAGTVNAGPELRVRVSASGSRTRIGRLLRGIASAPKAPVVLAADTAAKVYVGAVMAASAGLILWGGGLGLQESFDRALAMIIIACPCALALVTPLAYRLAAAEYGRSGILLKDPETIEKIAKARRLFLDKTGTLTHGKFEVIEWEVVRGGSDLAEAALVLEEGSVHPAAFAIRDHARSLIAVRGPLDEAALPEAEGRSEVPGGGVGARIGGADYAIKPLSGPEEAAESSVLGRTRSVGSPALIPTPVIRTEIGIYRDNELRVRIRLGDRLRRDSAASVARLKEQFSSVELITGDREPAAAAVAELTGIPRHRSSMSPEAKRDLVASTPLAVIVGDGANDAAAMSEAWVSIAVQGSIEVSLQCADVYLAAPGVAPVAELTAVARRTAAAVRWALGISFFYNVIGVWLALSGRVDPLVAAVAMPVSSATVLAVCYGMIRRPKTTPAGGRAA
jgi:cation transport ATPase